MIKVILRAKIPVCCWRQFVAGGSLVLIYRRGKEKRPPCSLETNGADAGFTPRKEHGMTLRTILGTFWRFFKWLVGRNADTEGGIVIWWRRRRSRER